MSGTVFLGQTELRVEETEGIAQIEIRRAGSLAGDVQVTYGVTPISATQGEDFALGGTTVTIPDGVASITVPITILDDGLGEATETFTFALVNADGASLSAPRTARVSILDDETPAPPPPEEPPLVSDYTLGTEFLVGGLTQPVRFVFNPADPTQIFIAEKGGVVRVADIETGESTVFLDISDRVNEAQDRGLLGIALHPDFAENGYVYLYYTVDPPETAGRDGNAGQDGAGNRYNVLERFTADPATGFTTPIPGSGTILLGGAARGLIDVSGGGELDFTDPGNEDLPASDRYIDPDDPDPPELVNGFKEDFIKIDSRSHIGGALRFGPDGALYLSIGDGISFNYIDPRGPDVQSLDSLSGKVLRIDPLTGDGLADNPFVTSGLDLDSNRAKIYQLGLRNPFSMAFDDSGRLVLTDVGQGGWEEVNSGGPGANFGWPFYEGVDGGVNDATPGYGERPEAQEFFDAVARGDIIVTAPLRAFSHAAEDPGFQLQSIVSGSVVYSGDRYPAEFVNDLFFSDFLTGNVFTVDIDASDELRFIGELPGLIHLEQGPDGFLYAANIYGGTISRVTITPNLVGPQAPVAIGDAAPLAAEGEFRLTPATDFAVGGVVNSTRVDLRQDARFVFELNFGADDGAADGIAFILHDDPDGRTALGDAGEALGFVGLSNAIGIEFDTYQNGAGDPAADHAQIRATGDGGFGGAAGIVELGNLEDGAWHRIEVTWDAETSTLSYSVDGVLRDSRVGALSPALGGSDFAWFLIAGATGGFVAEHRLRLVATDVTFENVAAAQAPVILGGAARSLAVAENASGPVLVPDATDAEGGPITWSIAGGPDAARFTVNATTGAVAFLAAPDFEAPADSNGDNLYRFTLRATDGGGLFAEQVVEIRVTDQADEGIRGGPGAERLDGTAGPDLIAGEGGADSIYGLDGADTILASLGDGNDLLSGGAGTRDAYSLAATSAAATASLATGRAGSAEAGADTLGGIEDLVGGGGGDSLVGNSLANILRGGGGADSLAGAGGTDTLEGGAGDDRLDGGSGADSLGGGAGNDTYVIASGDRVVEEAGAGRDLVLSSSGYSLPDAVEWLELLGTARDGNGNALDNLIRGQGAANRLQGRGGADTLQGLGGADTLIGGTGADRIEGGSGGDIILFNAPNEGGDRLFDYAGTHDAIHVSARGFGAGLVEGMDLVATKRLISRADGLSNAPVGTGQFVYETDARLLRWDPDGRGGASAILIADLSTATGWTSTEIVVIA